MSDFYKVTEPGNLHVLSKETSGIEAQKWHQFAKAQRIESVPLLPE